LDASAAKVTTVILRVNRFFNPIKSRRFHLRYAKQITEASAARAELLRPAR